MTRTERSPMDPYRLEDSESDWLTITEHDGRPGAALLRSARGGVEVRPDNIPAVTAAFYRACGLPVPLILPRPEYTGGIEHAGDDDLYAYTGRIGSKVTIGWRGIEPTELDPDEALEFAAHIAVNAEAAERGEPDPDEVEELAIAIRAGLHPDSGRPSDTDRSAARTALRWLNARKTAAS